MDRAGIFATTGLLTNVQVLDLDIGQSLDMEVLFVAFLHAARNMKDLTLGMELVETIAPTYLREHIDQLVKLIMITSLNTSLVPSAI